MTAWQHAYYFLPVSTAATACLVWWCGTLQDVVAMTKTRAAKDRHRQLIGAGLTYYYTLHFIAVGA